MGQFRENLASQSGWIHELARAEIHPDAERVFQLGKSFDPQQLVEESTIEFLTALRDCFTEYASTLNSYSEAGSRFQEAKIYSIAQTPADFMVFRNQVKLVVCNSAHGVIQISFSKHVRSPYAIDGVDGSDTRKEESSDWGDPKELIAQIGAFRDIYWTFEGERVTPAQVAKFYFSEFVKATRNFSPSRAGNQLLLEEIKSFLHGKGIDV